MNSRMALVLIGLAILMFPAASGVEQYYSGPMKLGPFTWADGEPIEGATVELNGTLGNGTNNTVVTYTAVTDSEGYATFDGNISYGTYAMTVTYDGEVVINGTVVVGDNITIDRLNSSVENPSGDEEEFPTVCRTYFQVVVLVAAVALIAVLFVWMVKFRATSRFWPLGDKKQPKKQPKDKAEEKPEEKPEEADEADKDDDDSTEEKEEAEEDEAEDEDEDDEDDEDDNEEGDEEADGEEDEDEGPESAETPTESAEVPVVEKDEAPEEPEPKKKAKAHDDHPHVVINSGKHPHPL